MKLSNLAISISVATGFLGVAGQNASADPAPRDRPSFAVQLTVLRECSVTLTGDDNEFNPLSDGASARRNSLTSPIILSWRCTVNTPFSLTLASPNDGTAAGGYQRYMVWQPTQAMSPGVTRPKILYYLRADGRAIPESIIANGASTEGAPHSLRMTANIDPDFASSYLQASPMAGRYSDTLTATIAY